MDSAGVELDSQGLNLAAILGDHGVALVVPQIDLDVPTPLQFATAAPQGEAQPGVAGAVVRVPAAYTSYARSQCRSERAVALCRRLELDLSWAPPHYSAGPAASARTEGGSTCCWITRCLRSPTPGRSASWRSPAPACGRAHCAGRAGRAGRFASL
eukprot:46262-Prymnesium_polylepis.1